jgi:hypothetical protein
MRRLFLQLVAPVLTGLLIGQAAADTKNEILSLTQPPNCFPAIGFTMPDEVPSTLSNWWCDYSTEYAFMGFSYEVTACM